MREYDAVVGGDIDLLKHPVVSVAAGAAGVAVAGVVGVYRTVQRLPVVGSWVRRGVAALSERGDTVISHSLDPVRALASAVAVQVVEFVLDEIDVTALVRERVDINAVAADFDIEAIVDRIDLDAVVARVDLDAAVAAVDIDAVIDRIDLIGLANKVIEGVDLSAIIRESTSSVSADVMTDVRSQSERADDFVGGIVDRMLGRGPEER